MALITLLVGLYTLWRNFLPWTQAVVVAPLIARARRPWVKVAWSLVLVATGVVFIVQSGYLVKDYLAYHKTTNIRLIHEKEAPFPAVTVCNLNPFKKSMVEHSEELTNLLAAYTYVNKVKRAQMEGGTTVATNPTSTGGVESHERKKRQSVDTPGNKPIDFGACKVDNLLRTEDLTIPDIKDWKLNMGNVFYQCFDQICTSTTPGMMTTSTASTLKTTDAPLTSASELSTTTTGVTTTVAEAAVTESLTTADGPATKTAGNDTKTSRLSTSCRMHQEGVNALKMEASFPRGNVPTNLYLYKTIAQKLAKYSGYSDAVCSLGSPYRHYNRTATTTVSEASQSPSPTQEWTMAQSSQSASTTPGKTTTPSSSTFEAIAAQLASTTEADPSTPKLDTWTWTCFPVENTNTTTTASTSEPMKTTTKPTATASEPVTTTAKTSTATAATTTDTASSTSRATSATSTSGTTSTTSDSLTSTLTPTSDTATATTSLGTTPTATETSTTLQATTTVVPTNTEMTFRTSEETTLVPTTLSFATSTTDADTVTSSSPTTSTRASESPTAYATTNKAQATSSLMPSTSASTDVISMDATSTTLQVSSTEPTMTSTQENSSTTTEGTGSKLSTTQGSSAVPSVDTRPAGTSGIPTKVAASTPLTSTTTATASTMPTRQYSTSINDASMTSSDQSTTETTRAAQASTAASGSVRSTTGTKTTAEVLGSSTVSQSATPITTTKRQSKSTPELPLVKTAETFTASSSSNDVVGTTTTTATNQYGIAASTSAHIESARATETAADGSKLVSTTSSLDQSSLSTAARSSTSAEVTTFPTSDRSSQRSDAEKAMTDSSLASTLTRSTFSTTMRGSASAQTSEGTDEAIISTGVVSSQSSSAPSSTTMTPVDSTRRPHSSTSSVEQGRSEPTTENGIQSSKDFGSSPDTPALMASETTTVSRSSDLTSATLIRASSSSTSGQNIWAITASEGNGSGEITLNPTIISTKTDTGQVSAFTMGKSVDSTSPTGGAGDELYGTTTPSQTSSTLTGSTASNIMPTSSPTDDGSFSSTVQTEGTEPATTTKSGSEGDISTGLNLPPTEENEGTQSKGPTPSSPTPTKPTTTYEESPKNVKPRLSLDFELNELTEEEKKRLEDLSTAYGLDPSDNHVLVDAYMKQALQSIAATMSPEQKQILGFQLKDLVSSCIINGEPCDMGSDFKQTFDVDYGNCYTFNHGTPVKYITKRTGSSYGLRMTIFSNSTETLPSSSEEGVKIVLHRQDIAPFPNVEGYRGPVGNAVSLQVTYGKFSKLGAPYGECSSLESIAKNKQPFYYNGSYSTEGCLRSCFQRNLATACGCADSRFPSPTDMNVPFCDPLDPAKYKCKEAYIQDNGDYFFVENCRCYDACEDTAYRAAISEAPWPAGGFFYGGFCPRANMKDSAECADFYSNNGVNLEVSFAQLGYQKIEEEPSTSAWALFNNLAGNSGLWIGYTMVGFTEIVLVTIQYCLWMCFRRWQLPEVPRADRLEDSDASDEESESEDSDSDDSMDDDDDSDTESDSDLPGPSGSVVVVSMSHKTPPKNFDNALRETALTRREVRAMMPAEMELYEPKQGYEPVIPVIALTSEHAGHVAHV